MPPSAAPSSNGHSADDRTSAPETALTVPLGRPNPCPSPSAYKASLPDRHRLAFRSARNAWNATRHRPIAAPTPPGIAQTAAVTGISAFPY